MAETPPTRDGRKQKPAIAPDTGKGDKGERRRRRRKEAGEGEQKTVAVWTPQFGLISRTTKITHSYFRKRGAREEEEKEEEEEDRGNGRMIKQSLETLSASEDLKSGTLNCRLRAGTPHWSETRKAELPPSATETLNTGSG